MKIAWKSDSYFLRYRDLFYVFKMGANGGRNFEITIKTENH